MHSVRQGAGKPLLLVHGLGSSLRTWDPVLPALSAQREVVAVDLPGFGESPPLTGEVSIATLTDAVLDFVKAGELGDVDVVGSSMGARMVLEMARRGHGCTAVALDPGGFWSPRQATAFGASIKASVALIRRIQSALPLLTGNPVGRTALLAQFSAKPWKLPADVVLTELRSFKAATSLDEALHSLVHGPKQQGAPAGSLKRPGRHRLGAPGQGHASQRGQARQRTVSGCDVALVRQLRPFPALGSARRGCRPHPRQHPLTYASTSETGDIAIIASSIREVHRGSSEHSRSRRPSEGATAGQSGPPWPVDGGGDTRHSRRCRG